MSKPTTNGDMPHSQTLNHFTSYPLISDTMSIYTSNPLGAKSISLAQQLYDTFAVPVLPYFQTPYSIVHPYLAKADSLGDSTLSTVDDKFPAIKSTDMQSLKSSALDLAHMPFRVAGESRDYVFSTYDDEYKKVDGQGLVKTGKAVLSTELRMAVEAMRAVADYLGPKKEEFKEKVGDMRKQGKEQIQKSKKAAEQKGQEINNNVNSN